MGNKRDSGPITSISPLGVSRSMEVLCWVSASVGVRRTRVSKYKKPQDHGNSSAQILFNPPPTTVNNPSVVISANFAKKMSSDFMRHLTLGRVKNIEHRQLWDRPETGSRPGAIPRARPNVPGTILPTQPLPLASVGCLPRLAVFPVPFA